jgi:DNA-directed RNA polymerase subunit M/transcription elongation factor TFIIS
MAKWKLNKCPRCGGYMFLDKDQDNWYAKCLQCSYQRDLRSMAVSGQCSSSEGKGTIWGEGSQMSSPSA